MTFDEILPAVTEVLSANRTQVESLGWLLVNRDLNGRVRLIAPQILERDQAQLDALRAMYRSLAERLGPHAYAVESGLLFEGTRDQACLGGPSYGLEGFGNVWIVDRLATEGNWVEIAEETTGVPRVVFFSIKGGVGRSTALAASAWKLAQSGKRVLVLDLDLESPGLSTSLLPPERQPAYGITDWLVEDLVDNADQVLEGMIATSDLSRDGQIYVVPAHGEDPGEYVAKLGRVWMPKVRIEGVRESWSARLQRLLQSLEQRIQPDVILIDSRAGIDEVASACVTDLGANLVLLFSIDGSQTWAGYRILFEHWRRCGVAPRIRERLRNVAALVPDWDRVAYLEGLRESAYSTFSGSLYDEIPPPDPESITREVVDQREQWRVNQVVEGWNFDEADEGAPHYPWIVRWNQGFAALRSLQGRLADVDDELLRSIFGQVMDGITGVLRD